MQARVTAPGKLILLGEHAAVFARPAIVAALGLRVEVSAQRRRRRGVDLELVDLGARWSLSWEQIDAYTNAARRRWKAYDAGESKRFVPIDKAGGGLDPRAHLPALALGEWRRRFGLTGEDTGLSLRITSRLPIGSGCGSSAAIGAATVAALVAMEGREVEDPELERLALEVERRQHGAPSGVDTAAVVRGGLLWAERAPTEALELTPLRDPAGLAARIEVYDSGSPAQSTGETVSAVRALLERRPEAGAAVDDIEAATRRLRRAFEQGADAAVADCFRRAAAALQQLGVVPPPIARVLSEIEARGGAAKISGAGALSGARAGCVLVYDPRGVCTELVNLTGWRRLEAPLGVSGLERQRFENPADATPS